MLRSFTNRRAFWLRWRRVLAKSWLLLRYHYRYHYRWHGRALNGRPSELVWYFAYGSALGGLVRAVEQKVRFYGNAAE